MSIQFCFQKNLINIFTFTYMYNNLNINATLMDSRPLFKTSRRTHILAFTTFKPLFLLQFKKPLVLYLHLAAWKLNSADTTRNFFYKYQTYVTFCKWAVVFFYCSMKWRWWYEPFTVVISSICNINIFFLKNLKQLLTAMEHR